MARPSSSTPVANSRRTSSGTATPGGGIRRTLSGRLSAGPSARAKAANTSRSCRPRSNVVTAAFSQGRVATCGHATGLRGDRQVGCDDGTYETYGTYGTHKSHKSHRFHEAQPAKKCK